MLAFLISFVNTVADFAFIPWVWVPLGILTWVGTIYLSAKGSNSWNRDEHIMLGAIIGVILGFISPALLAFSPVIILVVLTLAIIVFAGSCVAKLLGVDK
jgi:hypothetical protein